MTSQEGSFDLSELAKLITGSSAGGEEDRTAILEFFERAGFARAAAMRLLERSIDALPRHLLRLVALQLYLEKAKMLDESVTRRILRLEREITVALEHMRGKAAETKFDVPLQFRKGSLRNQQKASVDSAVASIALLAREIGVDDLSEKNVLDIGCGVKFTQAFYGLEIPVMRYHGVDVDRDMIAFLSANVKHSKFTYKHIDIYNAMYHKSGPPLSADIDIGAAGRTFDLICLFSVFTHLEPNDYRAMLALVRKYIAAHGTLVFTSFIDNSISEDFKDSDPKRPLLKAVYRESAINAFVTEASWSVERVVQHPGQQPWVVCTPI